ncbi:MADS-box transcription factor 30-like [Lolium perenne]|uniref:MADS-box transcription factor 30-like n=1 Tax=Lolium perenne TaxID=4522 RepID=UPI003A9A6585
MVAAAERVGVLCATVVVLPKMGRGKVVVKRIENKVNRQVTFSKRRGGLLKKAHELAVLCDAHVGVIVFSARGKLFEYCSPLTSWSELIKRYEAISNAQHQETNHDDDQQMSVEIARLRRECDQLKANIRRQTGEDLASANTDELDNLQKQLESTLGKVRDRKDELLNQQLDESRRKVHILEDHNRRLRQMINEGGHHRSSVEAPLVAAVDMASPATASGGLEVGHVTLGPWRCGGPRSLADGEFPFLI